MTDLWQQDSERYRWRTMTAAATTLFAATLLGMYPRLLYLLAACAVPLGLGLIWQPYWGLALLILAALLLPLQLGTGTAVAINGAVMMIPALLVLWIVDMLRRRGLAWAPAPTHKPLLLFLLAGILSLLAGNMFWDPAVPRPANLALVQWAQWGIFALSAGAFWLMGNMVEDETALRRVTWVFLGLGGVLALMRTIPWFWPLGWSIGTLALYRAPFWMLLASLAGGQLLFNGELKAGQRLYFAAILVTALYYAVFMERRSSSTWLGIAVALGVLLWIRFPRLGWGGLALLLVLSPILGPMLYEFAGGAAKWEESGGSRLVLIGRVVGVALRNPITGLGPASYRAYAAVEPLSYQGALWIDPLVSSHNNYADLFAHVGLLGLGLFGWFVAALAVLGARVCRRLRTGFVGGYARSLVAVLAASLVIMLLADWILPFVYNIGFEGFQASVLVWLFWGGLVAISQWNQGGATV